MVEILKNSHWFWFTWFDINLNFIFFLRWLFICAIFGLLYYRNFFHIISIYLNHRRSILRNNGWFHFIIFNNLFFFGFFTFYEYVSIVILVMINNWQKCGLAFLFRFLFRCNIFYWRRFWNFDFFLLYTFFTLRNNLSLIRFYFIFDTFFRFNSFWFLNSSNRFLAFRSWNIFLVIYRNIYDLNFSFKRNLLMITNYSSLFGVLIWFLLAWKFISFWWNNLLRFFDLSWFQSSFRKSFCELLSFSVIWNFF